ncbi:MAG: hypothetical protein EXR70_18030 [Deltaproteobacteria bacterium]|nr:hypothetical protein [Deltaproteobacteria bacterium]
MSLTGSRFASTTAKRGITFSQSVAAIAVLAGVIFSAFPSHAGSVSSGFQVSVRVEKSCRVSSEFLAALATSTNQSASVNCNTNAASGSAVPQPVPATVSSTWVAGSEESQGTKVVTLNF